MSKNKNGTIEIICSVCKKKFEVPELLDQDQEHPFYCQECPDPEL